MDLFGSPAGTETAFRVAYLPLDNRPVCKKRAIYLARSAGMELVMPEEHLYRTPMDNMEPNPNGERYGDRAGLFAWLKEAEKTCDRFVISLDQLLSGGLASSRWLSNTDLSFEFSIIDELARLCERNTVILFDSVMRLASTVQFMGYDLETYHAFRAYGKIARRKLTGSLLTIENIVAGYRYDAQGKEIPVPVEAQKLQDYLAARERKLRLADYLLRRVGEKAEFLYIGVDDASPQETIQTNEIDYLHTLLSDRCVLSAATDDLGLCCLTRFVTMRYGAPKLHLSYFGPGRDRPADVFDIGTLEEMLDTHLVCLHVQETNDTEHALQALILTCGSSRDDREALFEQLKTNLANGTPTLLIDVSGSAGDLGVMLFGDGGVPVGKLLGYSCWNTAANASGIALSLGVARYTYLLAVGRSTAEANVNFLKSMTFAYIKDLSYKRFHPSVEGIENEDYPCSVPLVLRRLNESDLVTALSPYEESAHAPIKASDFRYPWGRSFEMTFEIQIG